MTTAFSVPLSVTVKDAGGNLVANGTQVTFSAPNSGASATFPNGGVVTTTNGIASIVASANSSAGGPYTVTATSNGQTATFHLTNLPGAAAGITASSGTTPQHALVGTAFGTPLAATVTDGGGNPVGAGVSVTFAVIPASGAGGAFAGSATVTTDAGGIATAPAFTANTVAGGYHVSTNLATGALAPPAPFALTNDPGPATKLGIAQASGAPSAQAAPRAPAGVAASFTITALDQYGNVATGYTGTVHFTSSDPQAVLPPDTTFTPADLGVKTVTVTFKTPGTQSLTATDTLNSGITGGQSSIAVSPAQLAALALSAGGTSIRVGESVQLAATGTFTDGTTRDVSASVAWRSSDPSKATVDASGKVTGQTPGAVTVTATSGGVSQRIGVTVTAPVLTGVQPAPAPASRPGGATAPPAGTPGPSPLPAPR